MSKRQETPIKKNAFVHKLYSMLNDPELANLIWWTRDDESNTFALSPGKDFAKALTRYFKHGNVASFVRQLHMYGFHKVSDPAHLSSSSDTELPVWEFKHSSGKFKKNDESSLVYIKRRSSSNNSRNVYNNDSDTNLVIPTSTPSPEHVQYISEGGHHYLPQGYYVYNGHQMGHQLPPHLSFPPSGAHQVPQHQTTHQQVYYNQKPMPSSIPHVYSADNNLEKTKLPDIQRSISPQSQPNSLLQVPKLYPASHAPPISHPQPQLQQPNQPHAQQDSARPLHDTQGSHQPQHYTPNLQFRKIWENTHQHSRPRNPSLMFDPLAAAPVSTQLQPLPQSQNSDQQPQSSFSYLLSRSDSRSSVTSARDSTPSARDSFTSNKDSFVSARESLALARDSLSSNKDSFSSRDSFTLSKDLDNNRLSIKLPPPSSIHNPLLYPNNSSSLFPSVSEANSNSSTITNSNAPGASSNNIPSSSSSTSTVKIKSNSIPETSSTAKRPSVLPPHSLHEKLRPSLIELHLGSYNKNSILNPQHDSIGSQSSHNSVFSNNSSLSSTSSFHRTSSFGSISHHPMFSNKNSVSIAPHEVLPTNLPHLRASNPEQEANPSESTHGTPPLQRHNMVTPKAHQSNSPIKRPSTTILSNSGAPPVPMKIRSLNSSPLSRPVVNEEAYTLESNGQSWKSSNTKVSIHSLLDDQIEDKIILPSKSNIKAGLREDTEVITEQNEEKDANEDIIMGDKEIKSCSNDHEAEASESVENNTQNSTSLVDLKRQKLE